MRTCRDVNAERGVPTGVGSAKQSRSARRLSFDVSQAAIVNELIELICLFLFIFYDNLYLLFGVTELFLT